MKAKNLEIGYLAYYPDEKMPVLISGFKGEILEMGVTTGQFKINHAWYVDCKDIEPLPITPDNLRKLGFIKPRENEPSFYHTKYQVWIHLIDGEYWRFVYAQYHMKVEAIHHIQRLYDDINHTIIFQDEAEAIIESIMKSRLNQ